MTLMADALLKAGKITHKQAEKAEKEVRAAEAEKVEEKKKHKGSRINSTANSHDEKYKVFDDLWNNPKSKGFCKHLIYSFVPHNKVEKVWEFEDGMDHRCCFCQTKIITANEAIRKACDTAGDNLIKRARFEVDNQDDPDLDQKRNEFVEKMGKDTFGDVKLGYRGENSKKIICFPCYTEFYDWITVQMFSNRELQKMIHRMRMDSAKRVAV